MEEFTLREIITILRNRILYLIIIPVLILIIAIIFLSNQPNVYSATTKLYVLMDYTDSIGQIRYDTNVSAQFVGDFKELIGTPQIIDSAESVLENNIDLENDVDFNISAVTGTRILNVTATSIYPTVSVLAANTISQVFVEYIANITKTDTITIASEAVLPDEPSGPSRLKISVIVYIGALLLLSVIFIALGVLDTTFHSSEEVEAKLGLTVLASVEDYRKSIKKFFTDSGAKRNVANYVSSLTRESVKTLATNIEFVFAGRPMQTLMITSTLSTEGKSSLCILLAGALANDGYRVLIVDTDFRKPSIAKYMGVRHKCDIIDYIFNNATFDEVIHHSNQKYVDYTDYTHEFASTSHIYNYKAFKQFIEEAKQVYDVILFDTPPLGLFIDAAILSAMVDGTLVVIGKGIANNDGAKEVVGQLQKANASIVGVALNYTSLHSGSNYYYAKKYYKQYN